MNATNITDVLWGRHARASECIWIPQCNLTLRSGAVGASNQFIRLNDDDTSVGDPGDIVVCLPGQNCGIAEQEAARIWNAAASAWANIPKGAVAVSVNRIVNEAGQPIASGMAIENQITMPWLIVSDLTHLCQADDRQLAHEIGHILSLPAATGTNGTNDNLMYEAAAGPVLSAEQCRQARGYLAANAAVLDASAGIKTGLSDQLFDGIGDADPGLPYLDIVNSVVVNKTAADGTLLFCAGLAGLIPESESRGETGAVCVAFVLDCDNNPGTGDNAGLEVPGLDFPGAEFVIQVLIDHRTNALSVLKAATGLGFFINVELQPGVLTSQTTIGNLRICGPTPSYKGPLSIPFTTEVQTTLAAGAITPMSSRLRLQIATAPGANQPPADTGPVAGAVIELEPLPFPKLSTQPSIAPGQTLAIRVTQMPTNVPLRAFAGAFEIDPELEVVTDGKGTAQFGIKVPEDAPLGPMLLTIGVEDATTALTADAIIRIVECPPDLNEDGQLAITDFLTFQNFWQAEQAVADYDGDGELSVFDFLAYQSAFMKACTNVEYPLGWLIDVENPVLGPVGSGFPQQTKIRVSATFATNLFAFAAGQFDLLFSEGAHGMNWTSNKLLSPLNFDPNPVGTPVSGRFERIRPGQIHFPPAGIMADNRNPIPAWEVTYIATHFSTERVIEVRTETDRFDVYLSADSAASEIRSIEQEGIARFHILAPPRLRIERMDNKVVISWSTNTIGYALQKTLSLTPPPPFDWAPVGTTPTLNGDQYQVEENIGTESYYRLFKMIPQR